MRIADYGMRNKKRGRMRYADCEDSTLNDSTELVEISTSRALNSKGFTLIEAVITIVIVGIISSIAAVIILQALKAGTKEQDLSNVHYQTRIAMERMAREIRMIRSTAAITTFTATNLRFTDVNGATLGFQYINPTLFRWNGATNDVLASGVTVFSFSYYKNDNSVAVLPADLNLLWFIDIAMTSQPGSEPLQMRARVHPRNF